MREVIGLGLIMNGKSVNSRNPEDLKLAEEFILKQKPNVGAFTYEVLPLIDAGDMAASHYFVGANLYVLQKPEKLAYVIPQEGATMYQENICLLKTAPNKENALKFLEFFMRPEISVINTIQQTNGSVNTGAIALLPENLKNNPNVNPPPEVRAKLQIFEDLGPESQNVRSGLDSYKDQLSAQKSLEHRICRLRMFQPAFRLAKKRLRYGVNMHDEQRTRSFANIT